MRRTFEPRLRAALMLAAAPFLVAMPECNVGFTDYETDYGNGQIENPQNANDSGFVSWSYVHVSGAEISGDTAEACAAAGTEQCLEGSCPSPEDIQACLAEDADECGDETPGGCPVEAGPFDSCFGCVGVTLTVPPYILGSCSFEADCDLVYDPVTRLGTSAACVPNAGGAGDYCLQLTFEGEGDRGAGVNRGEGGSLQQQSGGVRLSGYLGAARFVQDRVTYQGTLTSSVPGSERGYVLTISSGNISSSSGAGANGSTTLPAPAANP